MSLAYWVQTPHPFLIRFTENFGIRYYGLAYVLGFLAAAWLFRRYARRGRTTLAAENIPDLMVAIVVGVAVGGRLGYFLFYHPDTLLRDPLELFRVWEGGMASHGGFIGVTIALWYFARAHKVSFFHLGDLVASTTSVGLLLGRLANFNNGELWGKATRVPWAVIFPLSEAPNTPTHLILPRHPSQLYEAALEGALMLVFVQWRFWRTDVVRTQPGRLCGEFLIGYALVRVFCELFREPDLGVSLVFGLSRGTFYSLFLFGAGVALVLRGRRSNQNATS